MNAGKYGNGLYCSPKCENEARNLNSGSKTEIIDELEQAMSRANVKEWINHWETVTLPAVARIFFSQYLRHSEKFLSDNLVDYLNKDEKILLKINNGWYFTTHRLCWLSREEAGSFMHTFLREVKYSEFGRLIFRQIKTGIIFKKIQPCMETPSNGILLIPKQSYDLTKSIIKEFTAAYEMAYDDQMKRTQ